LTPIQTQTRPAVRTALVAAALILPILGGCASETPREPPPAPMTRPAPPPVATQPLEAPKPTYRGPWEDPSSPLYRRTVYFDYDSVEVKPEYLDVIRTHGTYLGTHTATHVTLEGNTDERGTREYNLALGDRRAEAVRQLMLAEGVTPAQLSTLSYGEERPADPGHTDEAWAKNRRVVIQY
jgi:peptidoglycan-associated lipoprotein